MHKKESRQHSRITQDLRDIGAAWAVRSDKFCDPSDPLEAQIAGTKTYHIHPDSSYPHQKHILRFRSLREIEGYIRSRKATRIAWNQGEERKAMEIMEDFFLSLPPL